MMLFIDYETYYDDVYKLKNKNSGMIRTEYLNDPRFKVHGAAVALDDGDNEWVTGPQLREFFGDVAPHIDGMCCHNGLFDHGITSKFFGGAFTREVML
ncbi:MAG TPA: hypothetical protein DCS42_12325, partial [Nitrospiraceae bacterium]|nr:hypothetical protein [Nitrospiraceae bacterium]